jgi:hypothetical protein
MPTAPKWIQFCAHGGSAMNINALPLYDTSDNATGCCPRFNPEGWDGRELHFREKKFLRATTRSAMHIPLNMGTVFTRVQNAIAKAKADDPNDVIVLSRDLSPWSAEHLFAVSHDVEGEEMCTLSGNFLTKLFEGPYREARHWVQTLEHAAREKGAEPGKIFFFYTTCPKCAAAYGQNYIVGVVELLTPTP